jgi:1-pyrroline-5-carboxylate dehydrogenase
LRISLLKMLMNRRTGETGGKNFHLIHKSADVKSAVTQTIRGAFEVSLQTTAWHLQLKSLQYSGQKCSACSRLYVPESLWPDFRRLLVEEVAKVKVGDPTEAETFVGPVIARHSYDKIVRLIGEAKDAGGEILAGGTWDDSKGFFIQVSNTLVLASTGVDSSTSPRSS